MMRALLITALLAGCDPRVLTTDDPEPSLIQQPLCLFLCMADVIGTGGTVSTGQGAVTAPNISKTSTTTATK